MTGLICGSGSVDAGLLARHIPQADLVIAADGGADAVMACGHFPHICVGDFDSAQHGSRERLAHNGVHIIPYSTEKNMSDMEIALVLALEKRAATLLVHGAMGNRLDHTLANVQLFAAAAASGTVIRSFAPGREMLFAAQVFSAQARRGLTVSLLPLTDIRVLSSRGLQYMPDGLSIAQSSSRSISNIAIDDHIEITLESGRAALLIHEVDHGTS